MQSNSSIDYVGPVTSSTSSDYISSSTASSSVTSSPMITPRMPVNTNVNSSSNPTTAAAGVKRGMSTKTVTATRSFTYNSSTSSVGMTGSRFGPTSSSGSVVTPLTVTTPPHQPQPALQHLQHATVPIVQSSEPIIHPVNHPVEQPQSTKLSTIQHVSVSQDSSKELQSIPPISTTDNEVYSGNSVSSSPMSVPSENVSPDRIPTTNSLLNLFEDSAIHDDIIVENSFVRQEEHHELHHTPEQMLLVSTPIRNLNDVPSLDAYEHDFAATSLPFDSTFPQPPIVTDAHDLVKQFPSPSLPPSVMSNDSLHEQNVYVFPSMSQMNQTRESNVVLKEDLSTLRFTDSPSAPLPLALSPLARTPRHTLTNATPLTTATVQSIEMDISQIYPDPISLTFEEPADTSVDMLDEEAMREANDLAMKQLTVEEPNSWSNSDSDKFKSPFPGISNANTPIVRSAESKVAETYEYEYDEDYQQEASQLEVAEGAYVQGNQADNYYDDDDIDYSKYQNAYQYTTDAIYEEVPEQYEEDQQQYGYETEPDYQTELSYTTDEVDAYSQYHNYQQYSSQGSQFPEETTEVYHRQQAYNAPPVYSMASPQKVVKKAPTAHFDNPYNISDDSDDENAATRKHSSAKKKSSYYPPQPAVEESTDYYAEDPQYGQYSANQYYPQQGYEEPHQSVSTQDDYYANQQYYDNYNAYHNQQSQASTQDNYPTDQGYYDEYQQYHSYDLSYEQGQTSNVTDPYADENQQYYPQQYPNYDYQEQSQYSPDPNQYPPQSNYDQYGSQTDYYGEGYDQAQSQAYNPNDYEQQSNDVNYNYEVPQQNAYSEHSTSHVPPAATELAANNAPKQVTFYNTSILNQQLLASRSSDSNDGTLTNQRAYTTANSSKPQQTSSKESTVLVPDAVTPELPQSYDPDYDYDYTEEHFNPSQDEIANEDDANTNVITQRHLQVWEKFFANAAAKVRHNDDDEEVDLDTTNVLKKVKIRGISFQSNEAKKYFQQITTNIMPSAEDKSGEVKLPVTISHKRYTLLLAYAKALDENTASNVLYFALFATVLEADFKAFNFFVQKGLSLYMFDEENGFSLGHYVIYYACKTKQEGDYEVALNMLSLLSDYNMNFDVTDYQNRSLLHHAVLANHPPIVEFLLQCAVDCHLKDAQGRTAMDYAKQCHHRACVVLLSDAMGLELPAEYKVIAEEKKAVATSRAVPEKKSSLATKQSSPSIHNAPDSVPLTRDLSKEFSKDYPIPSSTEASDSDVNSVQDLQPSFSISIDRNTEDTDAKPLQPDPTHQTPTRKGKPKVHVDAESANKESKSKPPPLSPIREKPGDDEDDVSDLDESDPTDKLDKSMAENVYDRTAGYVWGIMMYLLTLTIQLLTNKKKVTNRVLLQRGDSNGSTGGSAKLRGNSSSRQRGESMASDYSDSDQDSNYSGFSKRTAPPTDDELFKQGLGSKLLPPPAQSPDRNGSPILPPNDVQLAIAMSRANMKQHQPPSSGEKVGLPPLHPSNSSSSLHPPSLLSRASSMEHEESAPSTPTVPGTSSNTYSIGRMPPGVSWRYVNILDENTTK